MGYRYGVLGAGRQGTAAAFDLVMRAEAAEVVLGDVEGARAEAAAERVTRLAGSHAARGVGVDVEDPGSLAGFLEPLDAAVSAVPYWLNLGVSRAALAAGTNVCDLGGSMNVVHAQLAMDAEARERGVCVVPDCGEAPGMGNNLMARAMSMVERPEELLLYDGGIPLEPRPPWNYELTFNIDGLTNEYDGSTTFVVDGRPVAVPCLDPSEHEMVDFGPPFGVLEAFPAATASTTPWTLGRRVSTLKSKVLRYPGHAAQWLAFRDVGLFAQEPLRVGDVEVIPRQVLHALIEPRIRARQGSRDVVIARAIARGMDGEGRSVEATVDVRVYPDEDLGFTAMERSTGWHAAIMCHLMASGRIEPGATPVEVAVDPAVMIDALNERGFEVREEVRTA